MAVRGVLLDVDGTLILSNDAHARAWTEAFRQNGYHVSYEQVRPLIGMGGKQLIRTIVPGLTTEEGPGKAIDTARKEIFKTDYLPHLQPAPGARSLVERMLAARLALVVASSSPQDELEQLLRVAQVSNLLPDRITASDVEQAKPAPDVVRVALERIDLPAAEVLMLGDTSYDIASAGECGVGVIALRCGGTPEQRLRGAVAIYDDPADLLAHYDTSPLGRASPGRAATAQ